MRDFADVFKRMSASGLIILLAFLGADVFLWNMLMRAGTDSSGRIYFLDVGQGDSELMIFPSHARVLTDAGSAGQVAWDLEKILSPGDRYIDVAIISHPQLDHFNGFISLLHNGYSFGAFIYNGRDDGPWVGAWKDLLGEIRSRRIPLITLQAGDAIDAAGEGNISMLSPNTDLVRSQELNDTGFVELITAGKYRILLTADIGMNVERWLVAKYGDGIRAQVLKMGHHGSRYSSSEDFLRAVNPDVAVIEVGAKNTYGHPAKAALGRIASSTHATILRTDRNGTISIGWNRGKLLIEKEK